MEHGRIVEDGTPADLIAGTGRFAKLHAAWRDTGLARRTSRYGQGEPRDPLKGGGVYVAFQRTRAAGAAARRTMKEGGAPGNQPGSPTQCRTERRGSGTVARMQRHDQSTASSEESR